MSVGAEDPQVSKGMPNKLFSLLIKVEINAPVK